MFFLYTKMKIELSSGFTILTKENCKWCTRVKELVPNAQFILCNVPQAPSKERAEFLRAVDELSGTTPRTFPMVFYNKTFVGGFQETKHFLEREVMLDAVI